MKEMKTKMKIGNKKSLIGILMAIVLSISCVFSGPLAFAAGSSVVQSGDVNSFLDNIPQANISIDREKTYPMGNPNFRLEKSGRAANYLSLKPAVTDIGKGRNDPQSVTWRPPSGVLRAGATGTIQGSFKMIYPGAATFADGSKGTVVIEHSNISYEISGITQKTVTAIQLTGWIADGYGDGDITCRAVASDGSNVTVGVSRTVKVWIEKEGGSVSPDDKYVMAFQDIDGGDFVKLANDYRNGIDQNDMRLFGNNPWVESYSIESGARSPLYVPKDVHSQPLNDPQSGTADGVTFRAKAGADGTPGLTDTYMTGGAYLASAEGITIGYTGSNCGARLFEKTYLPPIPKMFDLTVRKSTQTGDKNTGDQFDFTVKLTDRQGKPVTVPAGYGYTVNPDGTIKFKLGFDKNVVIKNIPEDTMARIIEKEHPNYPTTNVAYTNGASIGNLRTVDITLDSNKDITYLNEPREKENGEFTIHKRVTSGGNNADTFRFTVEVGKNAVLTKGDSQYCTNFRAGTGTVSFELKKDGYVKLQGIPKDAYLRVREETASGYQLEKVEYQNPQGNTVGWNNNVELFSNFLGGSLIFYNKAKVSTKELKIGKRSLNTPKLINQEFTFTAKLRGDVNLQPGIHTSPENIRYTVDATGKVITFKLKTDQDITITGLPLGTVVEVKEDVTTGCATPKITKYFKYTSMMPAEDLLVLYNAFVKNNGATDGYTKYIMIQDDNNENGMTYWNEPSIESLPQLPDAGGIGTMPFVMGGLLLSGGGAAAYDIYRRRKENEDNRG